MKDLKEYIKEGLFDDVDKLEGKNWMNNNLKFLKKEITDWIINNTEERVYKNKLSIDTTTNPLTVDYNGNIKMSKSVTSLTNGNFQWGEVKGYFHCPACTLLKSLEGAPKKVGGNFSCIHCSSLESLEGAPEEIGGEFQCSYCKNLTSLKGAPEKVGADFNCYFCNSLMTLEGDPKEVGGKFDCSSCDLLINLKGSPKEVREFNCGKCDSLTSLEGAPKEV